MKKIFRNITLICLLLLGSATINNVLADDPTAPPPPPGAHGASGDQPGNGAPIDGGLSVLLVLGAAYGAKKIYTVRKKKEEA